MILGVRQTTGWLNNEAGMSIDCIVVPCCCCVIDDRDPACEMPQVSAGSKADTASTHARWHVGRMGVGVIPHMEHDIPYSTYYHMYETPSQPGQVSEVPPLADPTALPPRVSRIRRETILYVIYRVVHESK